MKAAIPTNDGIMMASSFEKASGFLMMDIELGQIVKGELALNKTAYDAHSPETYLNPLNDCTAVFVKTIPDSLMALLIKKGISLIYSNDQIINNIMFNYIEHEVRKAADYCCCP